MVPVLVYQGHFFFASLITSNANTTDIFVTFVNAKSLEELSVHALEGHPIMSRGCLSNPSRVKMGDTLW